ncbi:VTT domain-containing protein [Kiritimatiellota bacterium B12222]|nr:VTT domain-containing protein [Kiritimatiellota bacterium B12222]
MKCPPRRYMLVGLMFLLLWGGYAWSESYALLPELERLKAYGVWFGLGYLLCMMVVGAVGVPPILFIVPAATLWSFPVAFLLCVTGGLGASCLGYGAARLGFQAKLAPMIPAKIMKFERRLETHAFTTVLLLRLIFYLFPPINWMLGLSRIPAHTFVIATFLGMLPATLTYLWMGQGVWGLLSGICGG